MAEKVLLVLVDGMRPDAVTGCGDERFAEFFRGGCYTLEGRTTFPPVTLPCHMSLFHSVTPERHGVSTNVYVPQNHPVDGLVERMAEAGKKTAFFYMWEQLRDLCTPGKHLSFSWFMSWRDYESKGLDRRVTQEAERHILEAAPDFVFLYLGETDEIGHRHGWMSPEYLAAVRNAWDCIDHICRMLPEDYSVIVTADHGGHARCHGDDVPEDMTIPMTFRGKAFPAGHRLENVSILDIAPTILELTGLTPSPEWEGKSVLRGL